MKNFPMLATLLILCACDRVLVEGTVVCTDGTIASATVASATVGVYDGVSPICDFTGCHPTDHDELDSTVVDRSGQFQLFVPENAASNARIFAAVHDQQCGDGINAADYLWSGETTVTIFVSPWIP